MQGKMTVIHTDGTVSEKILEQPVELKELQEAVGGYIQLVPELTTYKGLACVAFCNEEGKLEGLKYNDLATMLWEESARVFRAPHDFLVGNVVILTGDGAFLRSL